MNSILVNCKRDHKLEALALTEELIGEICEGEVLDELNGFKKYLTEGGEF